MKDLLDELKKKQASQNKDASDKNYLISNKLSNSQNQKRRLDLVYDIVNHSFFCDFF